MTYIVKEIFYTLQGEGAQAGRPAVFCRFAGCNLWTGHETDRAEAVCSFCDTDFVGTDGPGGGKFESAPDLAAAVAAQWPREERLPEGISSTAIFNLRSSILRSSAGRRFVVCTGGEPLLQMDGALVDALHAEGFEVAVETNGTRQPPAGIDWVCVSPKAGAELVCERGDELKLVFPQAGAEPERFVGLDFDQFFLQPMDGPQLAENTRLATQYCLEHPLWRLSLQTHKLIGVP